MDLGRSGFDVQCLLDQLFGPEPDCLYTTHDGRFLRIFIRSPQSDAPPFNRTRRLVHIDSFS